MGTIVNQRHLANFSFNLATMDMDYSDENSDNDTVLSGSLSPPECTARSHTYHSSQCASCKATRDAIKQTREALQRAEAELRSRCGPGNVFSTGVGHFWGLLETRDYMRARFAAANAILKLDTTDAAEKALGHFTDMLRLCRSDNLGVRDIIPHLLLRLGREQECYDFLKWWAIIQQKDRYDFGDVTLPYLDIHNADAFESIDIFCSISPSLSHLVALTLLKLRLFLDLSAYEDDMFGIPFCNVGRDIDRPIGTLVRESMQSMGQHCYWERVEAVKSQYRKLCRAVHDANPYFWEALVSEEATSPPPFFSPGSKEEADLILHHCRRAWHESEDAIVMVDADTGGFTTVYEGNPSVTITNHTSSEAPNAKAEMWQRTRGTGTAFPSKLKIPPAKNPPAELFPPTVTDQNLTIRSNHAQAGQWFLGCSTIAREKNTCVVSGRLENKGPFGEHSVATSNRAELRAVIAALRLCDWTAQGYSSLVIATDASYVVDGATDWVKGWVRNGWKTRISENVKNKDLWELLLGEVERWRERGLRVDLWKIPRELNGEADAAAKNAAHDGAAEAEFRDVVIGPSQPAASRAQPPNRILALCLEYESFLDDCYSSLVSQITSKAKMERTTTQEAAMAMLTQHPPPSVILVFDAAIGHRRKLWECVIDRLREGATVVLAEAFPSMIHVGEFARLFAKVGLPWKMGSCKGATVSLCLSAVGAHMVSRLPSECSQKAVFVRNVERSMAWYAETKTSDEAAVAFAKVGRGRLGYIGHVNGGQGPDLVVLAMCGLFD